jgi:hypothetical protein
VSADYFQEIEGHYAQRRGTPVVLNAKDWALMKSWSTEGIPLAVVIEAIDSVFDKNEAQGTKRKINSLSYCRHAVKEIWTERRELQIGAQERAPEENVEAVLNALAALVAPVTEEFADRIRALVVEKSAPHIEEKLMELEEEMLDSLASSSEAAELREEARRLVAGSDEKTRARAESAHLRRLARERFALPRLTLFT